MSCPGAADRTRWLDGEMDPAEALSYASHLASCPACDERARIERAVDHVLGPASDLPLPAGLLERALAAPDRPAPAGRILRTGARIAVAVAAAAAVLLLLLHRADREEPPRTPSPPAPVARALPEMRTAVLAALHAPGPEAEAAFEAWGDDALVPLHRIAEGIDARAARAALRRLARLARRESLTVALEAAGLDDRRPEAIAALVAIGDRRAVEVLVPLLASGEENDVVLPALVAIGGPDAVRAIRSRIDIVRDPDEAGVLIRALARADGEAGTRALLGLLRREEFAGAVIAAVREHRETLTPHLLRIAGGRSREDAADALHAIAELAPASAAPALTRLLDHRQRRGAAARALARIGTPVAVRALFATSFSPEVRDAFEAAGPEVETWLLDRLPRCRGGERGRIVDLLGRCGGERSAAVLATLAEDRSLAPAVVRALGRIGGEGALTTLARLARRPALRFPAIEALGRAGGVSAVPLLVLLAEEERSARSPVLAALSAISDEAAVSAIVRLSGRGRPNGDTLRALARLDPKLVLDTLVRLLEGHLGPGARAALAALDVRRPLPTARAERRDATMN